MSSSLPLKPLDYLITGTGRCGTHWAQSVFNAAQKRCSHEYFFSHLGPRNLNQRSREKFDCEASWLAAPYIGSHELLDGTEVIHLVRNPLDVIRTWMARGKKQSRLYDLFCDTNIPGDDSAKDWTLGYFVRRWVEWNELIERRCEQRTSGGYTLVVAEKRDLPTIVGRPRSPAKGALVGHKTPKDAPRISLDEILKCKNGKRLVDLATKYGYTLR